MGIISSKSTVKQVKKDHSTSSSSDSDKALELETVKLPTETLPHRGNQNDDLTDSDKPITEAEKLRHLYKKEQASGLPDGNVVKKDAPKSPGRQQYKTSGFHDTGRQIDSPRTEDNNSDIETIQQKQDIGDSKEKEEKENIIVKIENEKVVDSKSPLKTVTKPVVSPKVSPKIPRSTSLIRNSDGSLLSTNYSQHCPGLLEQTRSLDGNLRPLAVGKLGVEKNQIRTELEKQGILSTDTRASVDQIDPKEEGIIGELRKVGIIQRVTADDVYMMSNGMPKRRPPPRLSQLTQSDKDPTKPNEATFGKPCAIDKVLLSKDIQKSTDVSSGTPTDDNSEYFGTLGSENVGDAEKLKLKMIDTELL